MTRSSSIRLVSAAAVVALAAVVAAALGASSGAEEPKSLSGPAVSLYVVDHHRANPGPADLAPYQEAFDGVLAGCSISPADLASTVFRISDQASVGSGVNVDNLRVLRGLVREVGSTPVDCDEAFSRAEAHLEGAALG